MCEMTIGQSALGAVPCRGHQQWWGSSRRSDAPTSARNVYVKLGEAGGGRCVSRFRFTLRTDPRDTSADRASRDVSLPECVNGWDPRTDPRLADLFVSVGQILAADLRDFAGFSFRAWQQLKRNGHCSEDANRRRTYLVPAIDLGTISTIIEFVRWRVS